MLDCNTRVGLELVGGRLDPRPGGYRHLEGGDHGGVVIVECYLHFTVSYLFFLHFS